MNKRIPSNPNELFDLTGKTNRDAQHLPAPRATRPARENPTASDFDPEKDKQTRIEKALVMLDAAPASRRAFFTTKRTESYLITCAIRGVAVLEIDIPIEKYDGIKLLHILDRMEGNLKGEAINGISKQGNTNRKLRSGP